MARLLSTDGETWLVLNRLEAPPGREHWGEVTLHTPEGDLSCALNWGSEYREAFVEFLNGLAEARAGWSGARMHTTEDDDIALVARHDGGVLVAIDATVVRWWDPEDEPGEPFDDEDLDGHLLVTQDDLAVFAGEVQAMLVG